ncbi:MAG: outer membrane beta-barrel protein [Pseudomonadota bacterium]
MRLLGAATAIGLLLGATSVQAADLLEVPPLEPPLLDVDPFAGFYIGANLGWAWGEFPNNADHIALGLGFDVTDDLDDADGIFGGIQGGYNYTFDRFLVGIEAEINLSDFSDDFNVAGVVPGSADLDYFGMVTGRVGYIVHDAYLLYFKGGYAFGEAEADIDLAALGGDTFSDSNFHNGWTIGGGIEAAVFDGISVKLEYNYMDLESQDFELGLGTPVSAGFEAHMIRVGVNALF